MEVEGAAERRVCLVAEGKVWRVQLRRAVPAEDEGGRIVTVEERRADVLGSLRA